MKIVNVFLYTYLPNNILEIILLVKYQHGQHDYKKKFLNSVLESVMSEKKKTKQRPSC